MLVLTRKRNEAVVINGRVAVTVLEVRGNRVRLGIEAPKDMSIRRSGLKGSGAETEIVIP